MTNNYIRISIYGDRSGLIDQAIFFFNDRSKESTLDARDTAEHYAMRNETPGKRASRSSCYPCPALGREYMVIAPSGRVA